MTRYLFPIIVFDLQLFAEGGTGDGGSTGGNGTDAGSMGAGSDLSGVQYGVQTEQRTSPAKADAPAAEDRAAAFEQLIKGEYKDLYDARVQDIVKGRLKNSQETVERYNKLTPLLETMSSKYGVKADDIDALIAAVDEDSSFYEDEALEKGVSVETLKLQKKLERENASLKQQMQQEQQRQKSAQLYQKWSQESQAMQQTYPGFNLQNELQNDQFRQLLLNNIDVRTAYEVAHKDEIIPAAMSFAAKTAERKVVNSLAANGRRPAEGGNAQRASATVKSSVSQLTKQDMAEIERRVRNGERISFG